VIAERVADGYYCHIASRHPSSRPNLCPIDDPSLPAKTTLDQARALQRRMGVSLGDTPTQPLGKESHDVKAPAGYRWLSASAPGVLSTTRMTGSELLPIIRCRGASVRVGPSWIKAYIPYFVRDFPRLDPRGREGREGLEGFEKRHGILDGASGLWRTSAAGGGSWRMA